MFKDHFSEGSQGYMRYRPSYPDALFTYLAEAAPARGCAWDNATGSGQAARALAPFFDEVIATDGSENQIRQAVAHERVNYRVAQAHDSGLPDRSVDLVTTAQAYHWLDPDLFFAELRRVCRPDAVVALFGYGLASISPQVDAVVNEYYHDILGSYWPPERAHVDSEYRNLPFPFTGLSVPELDMSASWSLEHLTGYLGTWSAGRKYEEAHGVHPFDHIGGRLKSAWGNVSMRTVSWPLFILAGRVNPS